MRSLRVHAPRLPVALASLALACAGARARLPAPAPEQRVAATSVGSTSSAPSAVSAASALADDALSRVPLDDGASLRRAAELFQAARRADPSLCRARADGALVELLEAAARRDDAAHLASPDGDALRASARELVERALDGLRPLARDHAHDPAVLRALAVHYGLTGNTAQTARLVAEARARGSDPWIDFAELAAALGDAGPGAAVPLLRTFAASHPALLRARAMLARAQLDRGEREQALATLDDLLAANPLHDGALAMKARLLSPPPARVAAVPSPRDAPPPQRTGHLPRKAAGAPEPGAKR